MGRTAKFSFPIPGRKHPSASKAGASTNQPGTHLSKAQRILGDSNLNVDAYANSLRDDEDTWKHPGSRSSGMSISISESTNETTSTPDLDQWDHESVTGTFPRPPLKGKASSTILGKRFGDDGTASTSNGSGRLRSEASDSTLKSYYDRQKSPLSISQQTSASSARDLALRKGFPPVISRSPLLRVETFVDPFDKHFAEREKDKYVKEHMFEADRALEDGSRKKPSKPARLDLSMLFPRRYNDRNSPASSTTSPSMTASPSSTSTNTSGATSGLGSIRKLKKTNSKESIESQQSQQHSIRSNRSGDPRSRQTNGTLVNIYEHYEQMPLRSPHLEQIPESRVPYRNPMRTKKDEEHSRQDQSPNSGRHQEPHSASSEKGSFSWKNVRTSMLGTSSTTASISSRNTDHTKASKGTNRSNKNEISTSNLKEKSVLSLSSDSEEDDSDTDPIVSASNSSRSNKPSLINDAPPVKPRHSKYQSPPLPGGLTARTQGRKQVSPQQEVPLLSVAQSSQVSVPWTLPQMRYSPPSSHPSAQRPPTSNSDKRMSRIAPSIASGASSKRPPSIASGISEKTKASLQQQTPPLSPSSIEFRQTSSRSSRFMAVTQQEEALLEALRQKRARMREEIIEQHTKSPPQIPERNTSRYSTASTASTFLDPGAASDNQRVLLYFDTPMAAFQAIDTAEPSPDLSDFLSYGSDDDSTPRTSWLPPRRDHHRSDSDVRPHLGSKERRGVSPMTPPSTARLSAVGNSGGFRDRDSRSRQSRREPEQRRKNRTSVRFVDEPKRGNGGTRDFSPDDNESGELWRL